MRNLTVVQRVESWTVAVKQHYSRGIRQLHRESHLPPSTSRLQSNVVQSQCCTHSGLSCCLEINLALAPLYIPVILSIEVHPVLRPFAVQHIKCKPIPTDASDLRRIYLPENRLNMGELNKAKCNLFGHFPTWGPILNGTKKWIFSVSYMASLCGAPRIPLIPHKLLPRSSTLILIFCSQFFELASSLKRLCDINAITRGAKGHQL